MKENLTEIVCIIDKSASMGSMVQETITGFNNFLEEQKKVPGEAVMTVTLFDTTYRIIHSGVPLNKVPHLDSKVYAPSGFTALLDAMGKTIDEVGERLSRTPEEDRPGKILFCIITDGEENSSREYGYDQIANKVKHQREAYNWEFVFLGSNIDSFATAKGLNIPMSNAMNYAPTGDGTRVAYASINMAASSYRTTGKVDMNNQGDV